MSSDQKVVPLIQPKKPMGVWTCRCGSQVFFLLDGGCIQCWRCSVIIDTLSWQTDQMAADPSPAA